MNLVWNKSIRRFEAQFTDFAGDLAAVKAAGFKTDGPPSWVWWTHKVAVLNKLRKNKPSSGLLITDEALSEYTPLAEMEAKNEETKKLLKKAKGEAVKLRAPSWIPAGKDSLGPEDLPPYDSSRSSFVRPIPPPTRCLLCGDPTYPIYEQENLCLWCEKQDDKVFENSA